MRLDDRPGDDEARSSRPRGRDRATAGLGRIACVAAERPGPASLTWICTAGPHIALRDSFVNGTPTTGRPRRRRSCKSVTPRTRAVEVYFDSWLHWLGQGKTLDNGEPTTLQLAAITKEGGFGGTWLAGVPIVLQRLGLPCWASSPG